MSKRKIQKCDKVKVITCKSKGKIGDVLKVFPAEKKLIVSNINLAEKHTKQTQTSEGDIVQKELPIHVSNVSHIDLNK